MLISKIAKNLALSTQLSLFRFSVEPNKRVTQLNNRILQAKTWKEFYSIYSTNKNEFTQEVFNTTSRYVVNLVSKQRDNLNYAEFYQLIKTIQSLDVQGLTEVNVVSLLACLRAFCNKGIQMNQISKLKYKLCSRYNELLAAIPQGKQNFSQIIYAYYQMVYFGYQPASRLISERIINKISSETQNTNILTINQALFLLHAIAAKGDLAHYQQRIRIYILKTLVNKVDVLSLQDLVNSLVNINKMDFHDAASIQFNYVKVLGTKMLENITQLEEKLIFQFLKGDYHNQHHIFFKIYQQLIKNIYAQIQENGNTLFDKKTVLRLFSHLSSRIKFYQNSQIEKKKYIGLLKNAAKEFSNENDSQGISLLHNTIEETLKNRYFDQSIAKQLVAALLSTNQPVKLNLLEHLYYNKFEVHSFLQAFLNSINQKLSVAKAIKISTLLKKIASNDSYKDFHNKIQKVLPSVTKIIENCFESPQKFTQSFLYINRNNTASINLRFFHENHLDCFQKLTNPFQVDNPSFTYQYKLAYLNYIVQAFRSKEFYNFLATYSQKIEFSLIQKLVYANLNEDYRKIEAKKFILALVIKRLDKALETKQKQFLLTAFQMFNKYNRFVVCVDRDYEVTKGIVRIINITLPKIDILKQLDITKLFFSSLDKYIVRGSGIYKNEDTFREILSESYKVIEKFPNYLLLDVLKQGLRLNIVDKKILDKIDFSKYKNSWSFSQKMQIEYIKNNSFVPEIKNISIGNLHIILLNHNLQGLIEKRQSQINQIIDKAYPISLFTFLAFINQPRSKVTSRIVTKIIDRLNSSKLSLQFSGLQGAIKNLLDKSLNNTNGCRQLTQKIVALFSAKISLFSVWTHSQAIRLIISIPSYNPKEYYQKIVQYTEKNHNDLLDQVFFRLASTNYDFKPQDIKYVKVLLRKNLYRGTHFFLATESIQSQAERKQHVVQIVQRLSKVTGVQNSLNLLQYDYLKRAYPEQTKNLNLKPEQLQKHVYFVNPPQKIVKLLEQIAKANQTQLESLPNFQQNSIFKINNVCICFFNQRRNGSYHEHEFLKRALALHFKDQNYNFVFIGMARIMKLVGYIEKQAPQIITPEVNQAISQYLQKTKPEKEEEDQDSAKPKTERPKNYEKSERKPRYQKQKVQNDQ